MRAISQQEKDCQDSCARDTHSMNAELWACCLEEEGKGREGSSRPRTHYAGVQGFQISLSHLSGGR
jgi:hypothetical protein